MLKRRTKTNPLFSMSSMTDIIFLLLIFFMITSTMVSPNAIKVLLPQGNKQTQAKASARVVIDNQLNIYAALGNDTEQPLTIEQLPDFLKQQSNDSTELYVSLYADEAVPYKHIVEVLNIANELHLKMVLATRQPDKNP